MSSIGLRKIWTIPALFLLRKSAIEKQHKTKGHLSVFFYKCLSAPLPLVSRILVLKFFSSLAEIQ